MRALLLPCLLAACAAPTAAPSAAPASALASPRATAGPVAAATSAAPVPAEPAPGDAHGWLQLGDEDFARGDLVAARAAFERASATDDAHVRAYARYRIAWCDLGEARHIEALDAFVHVVRQTHGSGQSEAMTRLHREALRDSTVAYAEIGRPDRAADFYLAVDPALAQAALATLIEHYRTRGSADAIATLCRDSRVQACAAVR